VLQTDGTYADADTVREVRFSLYLSLFFYFSLSLLLFPLRVAKSLPTLSQNLLKTLDLIPNMSPVCRIQESPILFPIIQ
jgi:hypothetical protein